MLPLCLAPLVVECVLSVPHSAMLPLCLAPLVVECVLSVPHSAMLPLCLAPLVVECVLSVPHSAMLPLCLVVEYLIVPTVTGTFLNTLKFTVKDCDPATGEPDDDVGYGDEYVVSEVGGVSSNSHHPVQSNTLCRFSPLCEPVQFFTLLEQTSCSPISHVTCTLCHVMS